MTRTRPITLLAGAALPLGAVAVAACGGGGSATAASPAAAKPAAQHVTTVRVAHTRLGRVLVNSQGRTLYLFKKDARMKSACSGACAAAWPPLRSSGKTIVRGGAKASLVATIKRSDGKPQVTYNGHPLYAFIMDHKAGDTKGEGLNAFGARWFAVSPAGKQVSKQSSSASRAAAAPAPAAPAPTPTAPAPTPQPAPKSAPTPAPTPPASNGIPQNNGGDQDSDNNGGPSDGDGGI